MMHARMSKNLNILHCISVEIGIGKKGITYFLIEEILFEKGNNVIFICQN